MKLIHHLAAIGLASTMSVGCASNEDDGTATGAVTGQVGGAGGTTAGGAAGVAGGGSASLGGGGALPGGSGSLPGGGGLPGGGQITDAGVALCSTQVINAYGTIPDMLIVLDRSSSMDIYGRWQPSKQAVKTITKEFEGLLAFGLEYFPGGNAQVVNPVDIIASLGGLGAGPMTCGGMEKLDVPLKIRNAMAIAQSVDGTMTAGLTPTGAALTTALQVLGDRSAQLDMAVKPGYVLLVTDGDPSCDISSALGGMGDTAQQDAAREAIKALKAKNIPTYVIGYQIDAAFQSLMNELAMLGGTMMYHPAESSDQIIAAFRQITKDVIKCEFELQPPADGRAIDPKFVRVQIDKNSIPLNSADGWVINGNKITLQGKACSTLKDGKGHDLKAQVECTEVVLN